MKRRKFTTEFKKEAARMLIMEGQSAKEVSQQLINVVSPSKTLLDFLEGLLP